jgi:quinol monooxygenase YgiN
MLPSLISNVGKDTLRKSASLLIRHDGRREVLEGFCYAGTANLVALPRLLGLIQSVRVKPTRRVLGRMLVMGTEISLVLEVTVKPDALDEFVALIREAVADDEAAEPGLLTLECFIDGQDVHFYERCQDSAAALTHNQRFVENYASHLITLCTAGRVTVYGEPSDELKAAPATASPRYLAPVAGFARS